MTEKHKLKDYTIHFPDRGCDRCPEVPDHIVAIAVVLKEILEDFPVWPHQMREIESFCGKYGIRLEQKL